MKNLIYYLLFLFFCISFNYIKSQEQIPDDNLGMGIVHLSMNDIETAKEYFQRSHSINAKAILERLEIPGKKFFLFQFDYNDPTLNGFYDYIVYLSENSEYTFFKDIIKGLIECNPNKELGRLGIFF